MNKRFDGYLLVSDMDGTLLNSEGRISERNIKAIEKFSQSGGVFTIATGRMVESVRRYLKDIPVKLPIILYNGTKIYDYKKEQAIYECFLEEEVKEIIKKLKLHDSSLGIEIYCEENVYIFNPCRFTNRFSRRGYEVFYEISDILWEKNWTKILMLGEVEQMDKLEAEFEAVFGTVNLIRSGENYLEIIPQKASKGEALLKLCKMLDIDISNAISVGDNMNDYEMINAAGYGFCVANGNVKLLSTAKYKCSSNDEHAIEDVVRWVEGNL